MISAPAFPPPNPSDPDEVGWPLCTAAAMWRSGRYAEAISHVETAAGAALSLGAQARFHELAMAAEVLGGYVRRWQEGQSEADPMSVPVSADYPSIEILETVALEEGTTLEQIVQPVQLLNAPFTLPAGAGDAPRRVLPPLRRAFARPPAAAPLILDFDGSILGPKPEDPLMSTSDSDEGPSTVRSDRPPPKR